MSFTRRITVAFAGAFAVAFTFAAPLAAQNAQATDTAAAVPVAAPAPAASVDVVQPVSFAPTIDGTRVGVTMLASAAPKAFVPHREHESRSVTMMIVGGAILVVGAVVGGQAGTIIMVGGGAVGIIGLIRYLQ
jgi:hypothetical protein